MDLDATSLGNLVLSSEPNKHFNILLVDIQFVLRPDDFKAESTDGASEFKPSVVLSDGVGDGLAPSA